MACHELDDDQKEIFINKLLNNKVLDERFLVSGDTKNVLTQFEANYEKWE